ncbi:TPA: Opacity protein opA54, partial [Neisseria gonorrhoeae]
MKIVLFSQLTLNFGAENESSPQKTFFSSLLFSSAAQAASEDNGRGPYVQADLA